MAKSKFSDDEFLALWKRFGCVSMMAGYMKSSQRAVLYRRARVEANRGIRLGVTRDLRMGPAKMFIKGARLEKQIINGRVVIFSDAHYFPGIKSTAHRALLKMIPEFKPDLIINNGDAFDGGSISKYPRIGWDNKPNVAEELKAVEERLSEVEAIKGHAQLVWLLGNHDARYETYLAAHAPQYEGVSGFHLKDKFPLWTPGWRMDINPETPSWVIVKHRGKGGIHATRNNALNAGAITYVTGHLHSLKVTPLSTARTETCWGVDCGTLADPEGPQFVDYLEDGSPDWRSGFVVLTFIDGRLLTPEMIRVVEEGLVDFRGQLIKIK